MKTRIIFLMFLPLVINLDAAPDWKAAATKSIITPKKNLWMVGYSNDVLGCIPSLRVLREGGYEGGGNMRYIRSTPHFGPWAERVEKRLVERIHELDRRLTKE